ncbi:MAG: DUF2306 domain-containing protein [Phyllobacteriaceae bacterium]|nr:DUF2306 domain-containing protein [Phyllobacteriaceae bacterium]
MSARRFDAWRIPAALILFSLLLLVTSAMRLAEIAGGPVPNADNARFLVAPLAIYLHAGGGIVFLFLGAFQFSPKIRARWPLWHRVSGRFAIVGGALSAASSLYMTETFPQVPANPPEIYGLRILFGVAWLSCLLLGIVAAMRRDIAAHRGWMMRAYAIALGGSTTAIVLGSWLLVMGTAVTQSVCARHRRGLGDPT